MNVELGEHYLPNVTGLASTFGFTAAAKGLNVDTMSIIGIHALMIQPHGELRLLGQGNVIASREILEFRDVDFVDELSNAASLSGHDSEVGYASNVSSD